MLGELVRRGPQRPSWHTVTPATSRTIHTPGSLEWRLCRVRMPGYHSGLSRKRSTAARRSNDSNRHQRQKTGLKHYRGRGGQKYYTRAPRRSRPPCGLCLPQKDTRISENWATEELPRREGPGGKPQEPEPEPDMTARTACRSQDHDTLRHSRVVKVLGSCSGDIDLDELLVENSGSMAHTSEIKPNRLDVCQVRS